MKQIARMPSTAVLLISLLVVSGCLVTKALASYGSNKVVSTESEQGVTLQNGFVQIVYNKVSFAISELSADFSGSGKFRTNNLAAPFSLQFAVSDNGNPCAGGQGLSKYYQHDENITWIKQTPTEQAFSVAVLVGCIDREGTDYNNISEVPVIREEWTISLAENSRQIDLHLSGAVKIPPFNAGISFEYVKHGVYLTAPSLYGIFDRGIVQMMNTAQNTCFGSDASLSRAYFLGDGTATDVTYGEWAIDSMDDDHPSNNNLAKFRISRPKNVVLLTGDGQTYGSGVEDVIIGTFPHISGDYYSAWSPLCWSGVESTLITETKEWSYVISFFPNDFDFPVYTLKNASQMTEFIDKTNKTSNIGFDKDNNELRAYMTGIYASPVGCIQSYYDDQIGIIAPTVATPTVGYSPDTNFFDPDNYISISAMLYAGDSMLTSQVKNILERTAQTMCGLGSDQDLSYCGRQRERITHSVWSTNRFNYTEPAVKLATLAMGVRSPNSDDAAGESSSIRTTDTHYSQHGQDSLHENVFSHHSRIIKGRNGLRKPRSVLTTSASRDGQLMHHFIGLQPTYESIAGSEQLGPNIFWTLSVLRYISLTQDDTFAEQMFPFIDLSARYILTFFDESMGLINAPGPLWIDVLVRECYTSDSNAMMVGFLIELAKFYEHMGEDVDFALSLRKMSDTISQAMNKYLWDEDSNDHFITQLNQDGSTRDFIDYDSNLIAVAFGVLDRYPERLERLLQRVDNGEHTHVRATWCCEIPYSGDREDCYIVGGSVCGDSVVTLGRIGYMDALTRQKTRDWKSFQNLLLAPLQRDLLEDVWLYERYDADGTQIRTAYYFEYPSMVTIMLREVQYGIDVGLQQIKIDPLSGQSFMYALGDTFVSYSPDAVTLSLPGQNEEHKQKQVFISGVTANAPFDLKNSCDVGYNTESNVESRLVSTRASSNSVGELRFNAYFANGCTISAVLAV